MGILGTAKDSRNKDRKKKPDELLSSVVRETAIPAAVELLKGNEKFIFPSETAWVMLVLNVDAIGGLSKRHGRDEAKGSIIELIGSDQIQTVATTEMLDEEVFGLIPTHETLARMEEYSMLTGAPYSWAVVWQKPSGELIVDLVRDASFADAKAVAEGRMTLEAAVGDQAWREHSGLVAGTDAVEAAEVAEAPVLDDGEPDEGDPLFDEIIAGGSDEDQPVFDETGDDPVLRDEPIDFDAIESDAVDSPAEPAHAVAVEPEYEAFDETAGFEEYDGEPGYEQSVAEAYVPEQPQIAALADQQQVRDVIARRFLTEDLNLDVRLDEFDATFAIGAPIVQIDVPQGATEWLGDQIAQLNRQANADIAQMRFAHEDELRTLYVNLSSKLVEEVIRKVAVDREGSRYKALKDGTERVHAERVAEKDQKIRTRKAEIVKDHEAQAKKLADQAAIQAEVQYKERNRAKVEREQADATAEIERVIEDAYSHDLQEILRVRRSDAELQMQVGQTAIFEVLADHQKAFLAAEEARLAQWTSEIQRIVDDNRQADITQANALAEQLRTVDALGVQRREHEDALEAMRGQHAERVRRLEEELERARQDAITQMQARDADWQHNLDLEKVKADTQIQRNLELLADIDKIESRAEARHAARFNEAVADRDRSNYELERASLMQSRANWLWIGFIVAVGLVSLGGGYLLGGGFGG